MMEFIRRVPDGAIAHPRVPACATCCRSTRWPSPWACTPAAATRTPSGASRREKITSVAADRAAGPHRRRARPRGRHRQGSPRDLPDRRVLPQRRRDAGQARLRAEPQARPARVHPPRLIRRSSVAAVAGRPNRRRTPHHSSTSILDRPASDRSLRRSLGSALILEHDMTLLTDEAPPATAAVRRRCACRPRPLPARPAAPGLPVGRLRPHLRAPAVGLHVPAGAVGRVPVPEARTGVCPTPSSAR